MDYSDAVAETKFAREMLDVDMEDNAYDRFDERTRVPFLTLQEITKRVMDELGKESSIKTVHDRLTEKSKIANEILEKSAKKIGIKSDK
jgi:glutamate formiminotransferase